MFERYDIKDLYLAAVGVMYPDNDMHEFNMGGILTMGTAGYGYLTILLKDGEEYIDLRHMPRKVTTTRNPENTSYVIEYIEPLSKFYTQKGQKKQAFSKKKALLEAKKHYNSLHRQYVEKLQEDQPSR